MSDADDVGAGAAPETIAALRAALRESETRFRLAAKSSNEIIYEWTIADGRMRWFGPVEELLGRPAGDPPATITEFLAHVNPEDRHGVEAEARAGLQAGRRWQGEYRVVKRGGEQAVWFGTGIGRYDETGRPCGVIGAVADVTARRRTEEALRAKSEEVERYFTASLDLLCIATTGGVFVRMNPQWEKVLGYTVSELEGEHFLELVHPDDREATLAAVATLAEQTEVLNFENRYRCKDGSYRWIEWRSLPQGQLIYAAARDITVRKQAEAALRDSEARYRLITENMHDTISVFDLELRCTYISPSVERLRGFAPEEARAQGLANALTPASLRRAQQTLAEELALERQGGGDPRRTRTLELEERCKDGSTVWVENTVSFLRDDQGRVTALLVLARDISERRRGEEERHRLQAQLAQAQKLESVGRLAGGVAHDFNNMLTVILANTDLVLERLGPGSPVSDDLRAIRVAAKHSAELTGQLLAFARKQTVVPKVLDLNHAVTTAVQMLARVLGENIELVWLPGAEVHEICVDPSQLEQVLTNLCLNARDAIAGVGRITITTANVTLGEEAASGPDAPAAGEYVLLSVADTGAGMDEATLVRVFEPFFTTKEMGRGTGLGLATVHGIVKQNRGQITVESTLGRGSVFRVLWPRHRPEREVAAPVVVPAGRVRGQETILVVEDEPEILKVAVRLLEQLGYTVLGAEGPSEALFLARSHRGELHLLLTDVIMPEMNGRDLARRLQSFFPGLRCLFMSGYPADVIATHGVLDEAVLFLEKPFSIDDLAAKVRAALDR